MSLLGFGAVGRLALGQITQPNDGNGLLVGVAGTGVARAIGPSPSEGLIGVAGGGVAGTIVTSASVLVIGAAGTGQAGTLRDSDDKALPAVSGTGVAGALLPSPSVIVNGVAGTGVAGIVRLQSTAPVLVPAVGIGIAGTIFGSLFTGVVPGVSCTGIAGIVTVQISGGGTSGGAADGERPKRRDKRIKTGLLPLDARPAAPKQEPKKPLLPPTDDTPSLVPAEPKGKPPTPAIEPAVVDHVEEIRRQIMDAIDASDIEAFLKSTEQDEQDAADIADVLALLD